MIHLPKNILKPRKWGFDKHWEALIGRSEAHDNESSSFKTALLNNDRVPKGFLAVYVGPERRKFVIPMSYLSLPQFRELMDEAAEEFGFRQEGGLCFPCDENVFEHILSECPSFLQKAKSRRCMAL